MGAENHADWLRAIHDPDTVHAMVEDYGAGPGIDRRIDEEDRAAGHRVRCPMPSVSRVELLKALAHPLRLRVVDRLWHLGAPPVSALAAELRVPLPALSNHLKRLRDAGVVTARREGRQSIYALGDSVEVLLAPLDRLTRPADRVPGRALAAALVERGWVRRGHGRAVHVTPAGADGLGALGFQVEPA